MVPNVLAERIRAGEVVLGVCVMYPAAGIVESLAQGWDFVWIDGQHGQMGYDASLHAVMAADGLGIGSLLRVPGHEHGILGPMADLDPSAIMVPMVNNADEAARVVQGLRFPPLGQRSYGGRRVIDRNGREYYRERELMLVAQIETLEAVEEAERIIGTEGIDALFFGPDDMKARMGIPINTPATENEQLRTAMERTARIARAAGKVAGTVTPSPALLRLGIDMGYQLLVGGGDVPFMRTLSAERLAELRPVVAAPAAGDASRAGGQGGVY